MIIQLLLSLTLVQNLGVSDPIHLTFRTGMNHQAGLHNRALLQRMLDEAPDNSQVTLPKGIFYIEFEPAHPFLRVDKPLTFIGQGMMTTILIFGPDQPTFEFRAFQLDANGDYRFEDLTLRGPVHPGNQGPKNTLTYAIYADAFEVGSMQLTSVRIDGNFYAAIHGNKNTQPGPWYWTLDRCDITATMVGVSMYGAHPDNQLGLSILNSHIHDIGYPGATDQAQGRGALVYTHPHVSIKAINSDFSGNRRWGNQHVGANNPDLKPRQILYERCRFFDVRVAILTSDLGLTSIIDCEIDSLYQGVNVRHDLEMRSTTIHAPNVAVQIHGVDRPLHANIQNCRFEGGVGVIAGGTGSQWQIEDTTIRITTPNACGIKTDTSGPSVFVRGGEIISETNAQAGIYTREGDWSIDSTDIIGNYLYAGIMALAPGTSMKVTGSFFDTPGKPAIRNDFGTWQLERLKTSPNTVKTE